MASYAYFNFVLVKFALYVAHIRTNVPGGRYGLLVYTAAGCTEPDIRGSMEKFKWCNPRITNKQRELQRKL